MRVNRFFRSCSGVDEDDSDVVKMVLNRKPRIKARKGSNELVNGSKFVVFTKFCITRTGLDHSCNSKPWIRARRRMTVDFPVPGGPDNTISRVSPDSAFVTAFSTSFLLIAERQS